VRAKRFREAVSTARQFEEAVRSINVGEGR